ncbi:flagellar biosynthesis regulator FlaF [Chelatococcus sp. SYSU_G07232]|uniref:Flagellar biosynthesis regulator FlaF n=1 Tax=Chelatococcus albus TaxID=3047466 RepID=A0ABT7AGG8_9HYPH|nr:flagellar biosynthesis regulator FlaF [Chelatococcus sp. SYSU_G07232]MDJ1158465.1 flagellar biosynthesis regulator FlaF [Chelatococcus sp. SYSU_G07232]
MQHAATAYARVAQTTQSPRELEANILMKAATRLQAVRDDWPAREGDLDGALTYNRKLWTILVTSVTREDNPLPKPLRQNIANLGLFIFNHTLSILSEPAPEKLAILVNINRELAAGLRTRPPVELKAAS